LLIFISFIYLFVRKHQIYDTKQINEKLVETKKSLEEEFIKHYMKQTEFMESILELVQQKNPSRQTATTDEPDHSLALKLANEINTMERNLSLMDSSIKGYKQLIRSIERLKDNLNAHGYEILDLLNKDYHHGLPVIIVNSYPEQNLEKGKEIISKILIPAVRYNDKLMQTAQIEVNVGV